MIDEIVFTCWKFPPDEFWGGISTYIENLSIALVNKGYNVTVVSYTKKKNVSYDYKGMNVIKLHSPCYRYSFISQKITSYIKKHFNKKTVLVEDNDVFPSLFFRPFIRRRNFRLFFRIHAPIAVTMLYYVNDLGILYKFSKKLPIPFIDAINSIMVRVSDIVTTPTFYNKHVSERLYGIKNIRVIENPLVIKKDEIGKTNPIREMIGKNGYFIYFGRIEKRKGVYILSELVPRLLKKYSDMYFVFVGEDVGYREKVLEPIFKKECVNDRVIFIDKLPRSTLYRVIRDAEVSILPSFYESFGYTILESMALSTPVVSSDTSGIRELVRNNIDGILVNNNVESFFNATTTLMDNEKIRRRIVLNAKQRVKKFSPLKVFKKYVELIEMIE